MADSILDSIKKLLGIEPEYEAFDQDIVMHINSTFFTLQQLGLGPSPQFTIVDNAETWEDYIGTTANIQAVKSYIGHKVRLVFDPPTTSFGITSLEKVIAEYEWRLNVQVDPAPTV